MNKLTKEQQQLVADNHNLIYSYIDTHNLTTDEHYDILALALCRAAMIYNPKKSAFSTLAYKCFDNAIKRYLIEIKESKKVIPTEKMIYLTEENCDIVTKDVPQNNMEDTVEKQVLLQQFRDQLSSKQQSVFDLLLRGMTIAEISKDLKVSRQCVGQHRRNIQKCYKKFKMLYGGVI